MSMQQAQVIRAAADVIRERGHCKHAMEDERGWVCATGAIAMVMTGNAWAWCMWEDPESEANALTRALGQVVAEQYPDRLKPADLGYRIVWFNNHGDTTQEDVLAVFEKTAAGLEETE